MGVGKKYLRIKKPHFECGRFTQILKVFECHCVCFKNRSGRGRCGFVLLISFQKSPP